MLTSHQPLFVYVRLAYLPNAKRKKKERDRKRPANTAPLSSRPGSQALNSSFLPPPSDSPPGLSSPSPPQPPSLSSGSTRSPLRPCAPLAPPPRMRSSPSTPEMTHGPRRLARSSRTTGILTAFWQASAACLSRTISTPWQDVGMCPTRSESGGPRRDCVEVQGRRGSAPFWRRTMIHFDVLTSAVAGLVNGIQWLCLYDMTIYTCLIRAVSHRPLRCLHPSRRVNQCQN